MQIDGTLCQIGVVTDDLDASVAFYAKAFGVTRWKRRQSSFTGRIRGRQVCAANHYAFGHWGLLHVEIILPVEGESLSKEWLQTRGPGVFHLGYATDDPGQRPGGVARVFETVGGELADGTPSIAYLDTVAELGYFIELIHRPRAETLIRWIAE